MTDGICDVCKTRPAAYRTHDSSDGTCMTMELCSKNCRDTAHRGAPLAGRSFDDRAAGDGLFDRLVGDRARQGIPIRTAPHHVGGVAIMRQLSGPANKVLQDAAEKARDLGHAEVRPEHLLFALAGSDAVRTLLALFNVDVENLRHHIAWGPKQANHDQDLKINISARLKEALNRARFAATELGHGYITPEHLLIGVAEESEAVASAIFERL